MPIRGIPAFCEDVDHTGRVVEGEVVERRDDTVVDHLTRARHLTVGVASCCRTRRLAAWRESVPTPPRLLNAAIDASTQSFTSGFDGERAGQAP